MESKKLEITPIRLSKIKNQLNEFINAIELKYRMTSKYELKGVPTLSIVFTTDENEWVSCNLTSNYDIIPKTLRVKPFDLNTGLSISY